MLDKPRFAAKPTPIKYPRIARKRGLEGEILIEVWLNKQGKQLKQVLLRSSGHSVLDKAAIKTIGKWKFSGAKQNGLAVAHVFISPFVLNWINHDFPRSTAFTKNTTWLDDMATYRTFFSVSDVIH
ncbi:energy transducer TonB [Veronia nyctiphanis]|uniref:energy transducer TonB n=1 Tax=Veronia nyctiphanis TaxID=1278244 RepID=UPI0038B4D11C